jgi:hypothetical protein
LLYAGYIPIGNGPIKVKGRELDENKYQYRAYAIGEYAFLWQWFRKVRKDDEYKIRSEILVGLEREKEEFEKRMVQFENGRYSRLDIIIPRRYHDVVVWYTDSQNPNRRISLRLNDISIALAEMGVFYKGEARDPDQNYPTSPIEFWIQHIPSWPINLDVESAQGNDTFNESVTGEGVVHSVEVSDTPIPHIEQVMETSL